MSGNPIGAHVITQLNLFVFTSRMIGMPYLNIDPNFLEHPKTKRLIGKIGTNAPTLLLGLWCFAAKFHPDDGNLSDYSIGEIESFAGWRGESGIFYKSCVEVGFIDEKDTKKKFQIFLHDWRKHQGHLKAFRQKAEAAAKARWAKTAQTTKKQRVTGDAPSMPQACPKQCSNDAQAMLEKPPSNAPTTLTTLDIKNKEVEQGSASKSVAPEERTRRDDCERIVTYLEKMDCLSGHKNLYQVAGKILNIFKAKGDDAVVATHVVREKFVYLSTLRSEAAIYKVLETIDKDTVQMNIMRSEAYRAAPVTIGDSLRKMAGKKGSE